MDPLRQVEDKKAQTDMGIFGARIYAGAMEETNGDIYTSYLITVAFFRGMFSGGNDKIEPEEGGE